MEKTNWNTEMVSNPPKDIADDLNLNLYSTFPSRNIYKYSSAYDGVTSQRTHYKMEILQFKNAFNTPNLLNTVA